MNYTPYKGNNIIASNHQHNQKLEWMSMIQSSCNTSNTSSSTRIKIEDYEGGEEGEGGDKSVVIEKEHMFDKVVTPSDVGKLNRLVIPKQHAEKYFPLDSSNNEKGLLLNFEDRTGKHWRFRYSYWNSSQSYVMTKGWSRFVKEKKLYAGDIVSFQRGVGDVAKDMLFIDWRRRPEVLPYSSPVSGLQCQHHQYRHGRVVPGAVWGSSSPGFVLQSHPNNYQHNRYPYPPLGPQGGPSGVWNQQSSCDPRLMNVLPSCQLHPHNPVQSGPCLGLGSGSSTGGGFGYGNVVNPYPVTGSLILLASSTPTNNISLGVTSIAQQNSGGNRASEEHHQGNGSMVMMQVKGKEGMVHKSTPVVQGKAAAKRLRLFGVNMDCPISHQTHDFDILSSSLAFPSTSNHHPPTHHHHHHEQQQQTSMISSKWGMEDQQLVTISMGLPSSSPCQSYPHSHQLRPTLSFFNETSSHVSLEKGKSSTSSPMSLDLDI